MRCYLGALCNVAWHCAPVFARVATWKQALTFLSAKGSTGSVHALNLYFMFTIGNFFPYLKI